MTNGYTHSFIATKKARAIDNDQRQHSIEQVHIITKCITLSHTQKKLAAAADAFLCILIDDGLSLIFAHVLQSIIPSENE